MNLKLNRNQSNVGSNLNAGSSSNTFPAGTTSTDAVEFIKTHDSDHCGASNYSSSVGSNSDANPGSKTKSNSSNPRPLSYLDKKIIDGKNNHISNLKNNSNLEIAFDELKLNADSKSHSKHTYHILAHSNNEMKKFNSGGIAGSSNSQYISKQPIPPFIKTANQTYGDDTNTSPISRNQSEPNLSEKDITSTARNAMSLNPQKSSVPSSASKNSSKQLNNVSAISIAKTASLPDSALNSRHGSIFSPANSSASSDTDQSVTSMDDSIEDSVSDSLIDILNKNLSVDNTEIQLSFDVKDISIVEQHLQQGLRIFKNLVIGDVDKIELLMYKLYQLKIEFKPIYKSTEGQIIFIKNFTPSLVVENENVDNENLEIYDDDRPYVHIPNTPYVKLETPILLNRTNEFFTYINELTYFQSLKEIKLFLKPYQSSFCILKFGNHLDSNHLLDNLSIIQCQSDFQNQFNLNRKLPLYANKYINRIFNNNVNKFNCDTLVLSNLQRFLPPNVRLCQLRNFILKFRFFAPIESIYFPIVDYSLSVGFIKFRKNIPNLTEICLRIILNLNNITWSNFNRLDFSNFAHDEFNEFELNPTGLSIDFAQQKHNYQILKNLNNLYISLPFAIYYPNPWLQIANFSQNISYQETNLYVINIAQIFNNDNQLWYEFWSQFGEVNSAKLINRQGEEKHLNFDQNKIGFVFYKNLNAALKAILKTNNKIISMPDGLSLTIQSSFAIQKSHYYNFAEFDFYRNTFVPPMLMRNISGKDKDMELEYLFLEIKSFIENAYINGGSF